MEKGGCSVGIDFGTSNSSVARCAADIPQLIPLEGTLESIPSAIFFSNEEKKSFYGEQAKYRYLSHESGRYLRNLKKILGTKLAEESTFAIGKEWTFKEIIGDFLRELKTRAEVSIDAPIESVVMGRPVRFSEKNPDEDLNAQETLESIARSVGFQNVEFMFEPVAAAQTITEVDARRFATMLVADLGGGTSDFSALRTASSKGNTVSILGNSGITYGGSDIDRSLSIDSIMPLLGFRGETNVPGRQLPTKIYFDLATWHLIDSLYDLKTAEHLKYLWANAKGKRAIELLTEIISKRKGHELALAVESAKADLSKFDRSEIEMHLTQDRLCADLYRNSLKDIVERESVRFDAALCDCLNQAGLTFDQIDCVILTGGTSLTLAIREFFALRFHKAELLSHDVFGAVGRGLGWEARRLFG